jgi:hypothetical protein
VVQCIYIDACAKCIADVSDLRDLETIRSRVKDEGLSFLTITLPNFARDFERSLELGYVDSTCFLGFKKHGAIPAFLQGMLSLIFDRETGRIYDDKSRFYCSDSPTVVDSIRQICLCFKKMEFACTPERVSATLQNFATVEQLFNKFSLSDEEIQAFELVSSVLWSGLLANICLDDLLPKHGPGATAERVSGNRKFSWQLWHERLEPYFPLIDSAYSISAFDSEELEKVTLVKPEEELPVRVTPVPKTLKGPRIIAIEPCCMQYTQQAIRDVLYERIESWYLTAGHVNFRNQSVNQAKALMASIDGQLATIDLSDASDRVPRDLALIMFQSNPDLKDAIDACRSTRAVLPDGTIIGPLKKFASMGSALCFPVESMYFYTICVAALLKEQNLPVTHDNCFKVSRDVYVYGDDIVVPTTYASVVLDYLQKYNCKVNTHKTFYTGRFRESCGVDAYLGELVTPIYLRQDVPQNKQQAKRVISWSATANQFYRKGYWNTATYMHNVCEKILGRFYPYLSETSSGLGRVSFLGFRSVRRWNRKLQRFEVKAWVPSPVFRKDQLDGYAALQKCILAMERRKASLIVGDTLVDDWFRDYDLQQVIETDHHHLERSALHGAVALKLRWVPSQ